ncbi:MAG: hypothetical protein R3F38_19340 [Gammaproteobacteria bacterium]
MSTVLKSWLKKLATGFTLSAAAAWLPRPPAPPNWKRYELKFGFIKLTDAGAAGGCS